MGELVVRLLVPAAGSAGARGEVTKRRVGHGRATAGESGQVDSGRFDPVMVAMDVVCRPSTGGPPVRCASMVTSLLDLLDACRCSTHGLPMSCVARFPCVVVYTACQNWPGP